MVLMRSKNRNQIGNGTSTELKSGTPKLNKKRDLKESKWILNSIKTVEKWP